MGGGNYYQCMGIDEEICQNVASGDGEIWAEKMISTNFNGMGEMVATIGVG